jgi:hypothetical protein
MEPADEPPFCSRLDRDVIRRSGFRPEAVSDSRRPERHDGRSAKTYPRDDGLWLVVAVAQPNGENKGDPPLAQAVDFEIAEQETVGGIMKAIQINAAPSGETPSPSDADLMQNLDDAGKASVGKLRALKAGSDFDRDYIRYEIEGHRKLLDIQEVYLKSPDKLDEANVAKLARGMIKEHLALLSEIDKAA